MTAFESAPLNDPVPEPFVPFEAPPSPVPPRPPFAPSLQPAARPGRGPALVAVIAVLVVVLGVGVYLGPGRSYLDDKDTSSSDSIPRTPSGAVAFSETAESIGGWVTFTDPEHYFVADFPVTPKPQQTAHPLPNRPPFTLWLGDTVAAGRVFLDAAIPFDVTDAAQGAASAQGGTLRSVSASTDADGHPSADFVIDLPKGVGTDYAYVVRGDGEYFVLQSIELAGRTDGMANLMHLKASFRILR